MLNITKQATKRAKYSLLERKCFGKCGPKWKCGPSNNAFLVVAGDEDGGGGSVAIVCCPYSIGGWILISQFTDCIEALNNEKLGHRIGEDSHAISIGNVKLGDLKRTPNALPPAQNCNGNNLVTSFITNFYFSDFPMVAKGIAQTVETVGHDAWNKWQPKGRRAHHALAQWEVCVCVCLRIYWLTYSYNDYDIDLLMHFGHFNFNKTKIDFSKIFEAPIK